MPIRCVVPDYLFAFLLSLLLLRLLDEHQLFLGRNQQRIRINSGELRGVGRGFAGENARASCWDEFLVLAKLSENGNSLQIANDGTGTWMNIPTFYPFYLKLE